MSLRTIDPREFRQASESSMNKLNGMKILISGPAGKLAYPLAVELAQDNEVWGIARFSDEDARERLEVAGLTTRPVDLAVGDFGDLPDNFDYVLHFAAFIDPGNDFEKAIRINAEGTGLLMSHCRHSKACLVVSTGAIYAPNANPAHLYSEDDPIGGGMHPSPTYGISKIAQEAVARTAARQYNLPTTIARMNASYSNSAGMPTRQFDEMMAGRSIVIPTGDPAIFNPIHQDDINAQIPKLLAVASVPATVLNWAGDDAVGVEEWCNFMAELAGINASFDIRSIAMKSVATDNTRRRSLIGDCKVHWQDGLRRIVNERLLREKLA